MFEEAMIQQYAKDGCDCNLGPRKMPCCGSITMEHSGPYVLR